MSQRCPVCKGSPREPINLRCEHHPCYQCMLPLVDYQIKHKAQNKFRVLCPCCHHKTVFYDLRHLIMTNHQPEGQYVTDQFLHSKALVKVQGSNRYQGNLTPGQSLGHTRRGSIQSIANSNKQGIEVKCLEHGLPYKYFCCGCAELPQGRCLLCTECARPHYSSSHRLLSLKQSQAKLHKVNLRKKQEILQRYNEVTDLLGYLNQNRNTMKDHFGYLQENLNCQFKRLYSAVQNKYNSLKDQIRLSYEESAKEVQNKISALITHQQSLLSLKNIELKDVEANAKFLQSFQTLNLNTTLDSIKTNLELAQLPQLCKQYDFTKQITEEWISLQCSQKVRGSQYHSQSKRSRRGSQVDQAPCSYRSIKDKQNYKAGVSPSPLKQQPRKLIY